MSIVTALCQAWYFFELLEDRGNVQMTDLHEAVLSDKTRFLWHDLWKQLVGRLGSIGDAIRVLESRIHSVHSPDWHTDTFAKWMQSWSICREEAAEYFKSLNDCNDCSDDSNLLLQLKNSLQSAAPKTSLEDFWQRVAAEWPELLEAAATKTPGPMADLLIELLPLLPMELRLKQRTPTLKTSELQRSKSQSPFSLLSLDLEAFTELALHIDVSKANAKELFESIVRSASGAQSDAVPEAQIYLEDFGEQMILWTEGVDRHRPMKDKIQHFRFAHSARAVISALKAELLPVVDTPCEPKPKPKPAKLPKLKKKRPQLPWCAYYHLRPTPVLPALT